MLLEVRMCALDGIHRRAAYSRVAQQRVHRNATSAQLTRHYERAGDEGIYIQLYIMVGYDSFANPETAHLSFLIGMESFLTS